MNHVAGAATWHQWVWSSTNHAKSANVVLIVVVNVEMKMKIDNFEVLHVSSEKGYAGCKVSHDGMYGVGVTFTLRQNTPTYILQRGCSFQIIQFSSRNAFKKWEEKHGDKWETIEKLKVPTR